MIILPPSDIYERAIKAWGSTAQINQTQEECAELIAVLNQHFFRDRKDIEHVAQEIADVMMMCQQMATIVGEDLVMEKLGLALAKTEQLLEKHNG